MLLGLFFALIGILLICFNRQISIAIISQLPSWMNVNIPGMNTRQRILSVGVVFVLIAIFLFWESES